MKPKNTYSRKI